VVGLLELVVIFLADEQIAGRCGVVDRLAADVVWCCVTEESSLGMGMSFDGSSLVSVTARRSCACQMGGGSQ
jgi:hypothetical protein